MVMRRTSACIPDSNSSNSNSYSNSIHSKEIKAMVSCKLVEEPSSSSISSPLKGNTLSISKLPEEVLIRVFLILGSPHEIAHILTVCRAWNIICSNDDLIWKQLLREGQYKLPIKLVPKGFQSWKDLHRVLELYREFISISLHDYIVKCCKEIIDAKAQIKEFYPKIRNFLSHHIHQVYPCDVLLHGHELVDTTGYHHHWCYAAFKKESGLYDFTRYYLGLDRKFHSFIKTHVDMMIKGGVEIHNEHEWICWKLSVHFFDTFSVNTIFDMLLAMFMQRLAVAEWDVADPAPPSSAVFSESIDSCDDDDEECSTSQRRSQKESTKANYKPRTKNSQKCIPSYNSKNAFR